METTIHLDIGELLSDDQDLNNFLVESEQRERLSSFSAEQQAGACISRAIEVTVFDHIDALFDRSFLESVQLIPEQHEIDFR